MATEAGFESSIFHNSVEKNANLSPGKELYGRLAKEQGLSSEDLAGLAVLEMVGHGFTAKIRGKEVSAKRTTDGKYEVLVNGILVTDLFLAERLYQKYYPAVKSVFAESSGDSLLESGLGEISDLI